MSKKRILRYGGFASLCLWSSVTCSSCYTFRSFSSQGFAAGGEPPLPLANLRCRWRTSAAAGVPHLSLFAPVI
ncbi:hypothetical protein MHB56_22625 [Paenibacillus sp. FSL H8-0315]|uniref:hypothetical protein n=1 Tax=Paenibacillus sp. FSL H8-0315 TaxID=2921384 RepID=UPI0030F97AA1